MRAHRLSACITAAAVALGAAAAPARAEFFIDIGAHTSEVEEVRIDMPPRTATNSGAHLGLGVRGDVAERSSIGARVEIGEVDSDTYLGIRAFDYAYHFSERLAATAFVGAARLDLPTAAYGYYLGGGVRLKGVLPRWDLGLELRRGEELARDNVLPSDPTPGFATFYDVTSVSVYLSRRF